MAPLGNGPLPSPQRGPSLQVFPPPFTTLTVACSLPRSGPGWEVPASCPDEKLKPGGTIMLNSRELDLQDLEP